MSLLDDISKTINYSASFGSNLSLEQLWFRLLSDKKYSLEEINGEISNLKFRNKRNKVNDEKIKLAKELVENHLSKFADILMVGITGSVAAENSRKEDDIDLFLICKKNTLWWTRLKLRIYIKVNNIAHRKYGQLEQPNDFCFNLWMDEVDLKVPLLKQSERNAVDLILMKVILDKNQIYKKLILTNDWAAKYVANGYSQLVSSKFQETSSKSETSIIVGWLNYLVFAGQLVYIRLKGPIKFINLRQAFFHK